MRFRGIIGMSFFLSVLPIFGKEQVVFKPNGNFGLQLKYFGRTEGSRGGEGKWNKNNDSMRAQYLLNLNLTEKTKLQFRLRDYQALNSRKEGDLGSDKRLRVYHTHNDLFTSLFEYRGATRFIVKSYNILRQLSNKQFNRELYL